GACTDSCRSHATNVRGDVLRARHGSPPLGSILFTVPALQWAKPRHGARPTAPSRVRSGRRGGAAGGAPSLSPVRSVAASARSGRARLAPHAGRRPPPALVGAGRHAAWNRGGDRRGRPVRRAPLSGAGPPVGRGRGARPEHPAG